MSVAICKILIQTQWVSPCIRKQWQRRFLIVEYLLNCLFFITVVEYKIAEMGYVRYYLAPKIEDDDANWTETTKDFYESAV